MIIVRLCKRSQVKKPMIITAPNHPKKFLLVGNNIESIEEQFKVDRGNMFSDVTVAMKNKKGSLYTKQYTRVTVQQKKAQYPNIAEWQDDEQTSCEMFVKAEVRNKDQPDEHGAVYAVVPAHLVLSQEQSEQTADSSSAISRTRREVEKETTKRRYVCKVPGQVETAKLDLKHPPLFVFRHWQAELDDMSKQATSTSVLEVGPNQKHPTDYDCPENKCRLEFETQLCPHMFLNDIALLHIDLKHFEHIQNEIESEISCNIFEFTLQEHLNLLRNSNQKIAIGKFEGRLVPYPVSINEQYGFHITFVLTSQSNGTVE